MNFLWRNKLTDDLLVLWYWAEGICAIVWVMGGLVGSFSELGNSSDVGKEADLRLAMDACDDISCTNLEREMALATEKLAMFATEVMEGARGLSAKEFLRGSSDVVESRGV